MEIRQTFHSSTNSKYYNYIFYISYICAYYVYSVHICIFKFLISA